MKILCVAVKEELPNCPEGYTVVYTGVGKVQAAFTLQRAINQVRPVEVWNYGTAGSVSGKHNGLVEVDVILQRDMIAEPLAPRGIIPYAENEHAGAIVLETANSKMVTCGTGDSFVTETDPWFDYASVDIVDMEAWALGYVCKQYGIRFRCFKYISDNADSEAGKDWSANVQAGIEQFEKIARVA